MTSMSNRLEHTVQTVLHINHMMDMEPDPLKRQEYRQQMKQTLDELESKIK